MGDKLDREKLLKEIEARLWHFPLDILRRFHRVALDVAKGTAVDDALGDEQAETDQQRGERLGTRYRSEAPFGKTKHTEQGGGQFGGLFHVKKPFEPGADDDD